MDHRTGERDSLDDHSDQEENFALIDFTQTQKITMKVELMNAADSRVLSG